LSDLVQSDKGPTHREIRCTRPKRTAPPTRRKPIPGGSAAPSLARRVGKAAPFVLPKTQRRLLASPSDNSEARKKQQGLLSPTVTWMACPSLQGRACLAVTRGFSLTEHPENVRSR